jgi:hypothetical protein
LHFDEGERGEEVGQATDRTSAVGRHISAWSMAFWLVTVVLGQPESENL